MLKLEAFLTGETGSLKFQYERTLASQPLGLHTFPCPTPPTPPAEVTVEQNCTTSYSTSKIVVP
jgi:hypothetical protein